MLRGQVGLVWCPLHCLFAGWTLTVGSFSELQIPNKVGRVMPPLQGCRKNQMREDVRPLVKR